MTRSRPVYPNEPSGLGGLLILPGIALIVSSLTMLYTLYTNLLPLFQERIWQELTTPGTVVYHPLYARMLISELAANLTFLGFLAVLLYLFFRKSYRFPGLFIAYLVLRLVFIITDVLLSNQIPAVAEQLAAGGWLENLAREVAYAIIWIPYFLSSKRVKNTFVEGRPDPALEEAKRHLELAYSHEAADRLEPALSECELAIQLAPGFGEAHNLHGLILESLGRGAEAIVAYREAVGLDPSLAEAWENLREARAEYGESHAPEQTDARPSTASSVPAASLTAGAAAGQEDTPAAPRASAIAEYRKPRAPVHTDAATPAVYSERQVSGAAGSAAEQEYAPAATRASAIAETPAKKTRLPRWAIVLPIAVLVGLLVAWLVVERPFWAPESDPAAGEGTVASDPGRLEQAVTPDPELAKAFLSHGRAYLSEGDYDRAIADFTQAIALDPQSAEAYRNRAGAYGLKGDWDQAIADYSQAITLDPQSGGVYSVRGWAYYAKGDDDQAIADFEQAISLDPGLAGAYCGRGLVYSAKGNHDQAIADLERARDLAEDPGIRQMAEEALQELGQTPPSSAGQADSEGAEAYVNRGDAYLFERDFDQAIAEYDQAIALDPGVAEAYLYRGLAYYWKGDDDQAIADLERARDLAEDPGIRQMAEEALQELGQELPSAAEQVDSEGAEAYFDRGNAYYDEGEYDQAIAEYDQAIALDPELAEAFCGRGAAYLAKGDHNQAMADFEQAIALDPQSALAYEGRGRAYSVKGNHEQAMVDFDQAIALDPELAVAYLSRGGVYFNQGDYDRALPDIERALDLGLSPELTQSAKELLGVLGRE